eukprot:CAMPEP_0206232292 /NCGR_PEP_ID=MMETSP0047_2-20121206/11333_1 /ASSEMBLY_ACC=CAM_ASM_000192 /TAXON_ID=195065 /ORGANISM="Chroomonas mesostigmatica_cf, Strain CCMP1168" /LENGTH=228 /DNA_ID=CAMNT_0053656009 /DNA_START=23 /DNA_END=709 /DNA_ORIENTATION=-
MLRMRSSHVATVLSVVSIGSCAAFAPPSMPLGGLPGSSRSRPAASQPLAMAGLPFGFSLRLPELFKKGESMSTGVKYPLIGDESIMSKKAHGTTETPVQEKLKWNCDRETADRICCFNRHFAEYAGYWQTTSYLKEVDKEKPTTYYDSVTGKPLFIAPVGRTFEEFVAESKSHGWPSFRDDEVVWENMRCLSNGEAVSVDGTHLGHNIPDRKGNRYCINLVSVAGNPK